MKRVPKWKQLSLRLAEDERKKAKNSYGLACIGLSIGHPPTPIEEVEQAFIRQKEARQFYWEAWHLVND